MLPSQLHYHVKTDWFQTCRDKYLPGHRAFSIVHTVGQVAPSWCLLSIVCQFWNGSHTSLAFLMPEQEHHNLNISRMLKPFILISNHFKPCPSISSHFQLFPVNSSTFQPFYGQFQAIAALHRYFLKFPDIPEAFSNILKIHEFSLFYFAKGPFCCVLRCRRLIEATVYCQTHSVQRTFGRNHKKVILTRFSLNGPHCVSLCVCVCLSVCMCLLSSVVFFKASYWP